MIDFPQSSIRQANLTTINTQATIGDHFYFRFDNTDSIAMYPKLVENDPMIDFRGKIFLERKNADGSFRFYRRHFESMHIALRAVEEFDYLPGYGIISFASRVPKWSPNGGLFDTNEFYRFVR